MESITITCNICYEEVDDKYIDKHEATCMENQLKFLKSITDKETPVNDTVDIPLTSTKENPLDNFDDDPNNSENEFVNSSKYGFVDDPNSAINNPDKINDFRNNPVHRPIIDPENEDYEIIKIMQEEGYSKREIMELTGYDYVENIPLDGSDDKEINLDNNKSIERSTDLDDSSEIIKMMREEGYSDNDIIKMFGEDVINKQVISKEILTETQKKA